MANESGSNLGGPIPTGSVSRDIGAPASSPEPGPAVIPTTDEPTIGISVVHGSLEYASYPVMVGHFRGATLQGAEAFVNDRLDGLLSARQMVGRYPQDEGEAIFLRPRGQRGAIGWEVDPPRFPPGAYVLGLGTPGELTRNKLVLSVKAALVERGIELYEQAERVDQLVEFGVATVLVGAFPVDGITVEASIVALVEGVLAANATFRQFDGVAAEGQRRVPRVRVTALEVIERFADRAELAAHAVRMLPQLLDRVADLRYLDQPDAVTVETRPGGLPARPPLQEAETAWRRVLVAVSDAQREKLKAGGDDVATLELDVTVLGRLARADRLRHPIDRRTVDHLVAASIHESSTDAQVANTLWELILPVDLKDDLIGAGRIQLIVDEHTANYPWELMTSREVQGERGRLGLARTGLLRQFREGSGGQRFRAHRATEDVVLVVGNPPVRAEDYPWMTGRFASLPGATREAQAVAETFGSASGEGPRPEVVSLIWGRTEQVGGEPLGPEVNSGRAILDALFRRDYRIVHVAAHGIVGEDPAESGAVIGGGMYLTANVIRQLPVVPDIVFLNCCHLARVGFNRLAAGIARELLGIGVSVVVAAGWAVDDSPAELFARLFYTSLLGGRELGDAVHKARSTVYERYPTSLTWGAYQCYGDPGYRLTLRGGAPRREPDPPVSRDELLREVKTTAIRVADVGRPDPGMLRQRREQLLADLDRLATCAVPRRWLDAEVAFELGDAYGELGELDAAVHWYRRAEAGGPAHPAVLFERLANREIRLAQQRHTGRAAAEQARITDSVEQLVAAACGHLAIARGFGTESTDRKAIEGSLSKKQATLLGGDDPRRAELITEAARAYREAHELDRRAADAYEAARATGHDVRPPVRDSYPALNWLQLESLSGGWPPADETLLDALQRVEAWLDGAERPVPRHRHDLRITPSFWELAWEGNLALTRMLVTPAAAGITVEATQAVIDGYEQAFRTRSSWRQRNSVLENLRDLETLAHGHDQLVGALGHVIEKLEAWEERHMPTTNGPHDPTATHVPADTPGPVPVTATPSRTRTALQVEMLPAANGDCLWIEYGAADDRHRILLDGGPHAAYRTGLGPRLLALADDDRHFDLLVITHIDTDHIDGAIRAVQERGVTFDDIWFNGWPQLTAASGDRGPKQGAILDGLLDDRSVNAAFQGEPLVVSPTGSALPTRPLPDGALVTLLSPGADQLHRLATIWEQELAAADITPGSVQEAIDLLARRTEYAPLERGAKPRAFGDDSAPANGSSIAFLFELDGLACLFAGDAHAPVLIDSLRRLLAERGTDRLELDLFKLPHHGSMANVTEELLALLHCQRYLVSTNGATFEHPDPETIELIGRQHPDGPADVFFNYVSATTERWQSPEEQRRVNIRAHFPEPGPGIVLHL